MPREKMKEVIVERALGGVKDTGDRFPINLRVGKPYPVTDEEWACAVELDGLYTSLHDQHGIDSFQSFMLALKLARELLEDFIAKGGKLFSACEDSEINVDTLFTSGI